MIIASYLLPRRISRSTNLKQSSTIQRIGALALHPFVKLCANLLSDSPCFFLINSYTTGFAPSVLSYFATIPLEASTCVTEAPALAAAKVAPPV